MDRNISEEARATLAAIEDLGGAVFLSTDSKVYVQIRNTAIRELLGRGFVSVEPVGPGRCVEITRRGRCYLGSVR